MKRIAFLSALTFAVLSSSILPASAGEVMTDRCSADVSIPATYNDGPATPGSLLLTRDTNGSTDWSKPFRVQLGGSGLTGGGYIRWWCHSTTGNLFDPGTWRPDIDFAKAGVCLINGAGLIFGESTKPSGQDVLKDCLGAVKKIGSSAKQGWTAERSRCDNRSTLVRARLGPNRLLQIECLGK